MRAHHMNSIARLVLLASLTILASSVITAGIASAATTPEFKPVPTKKKFTGTSGSVKWTFDNGAETMTCTKSSAAGEITGARVVGKLVEKFTGCATTGVTKSGCAVKSVGAKEGEIVTKPLSGELGTVKTTEAASGVGLLLKPETLKTWTEIASDECLKETKMTGTLAAEVATIGKKLTTNRLVFSASGISQAIKTITLDSGTVAEPELVMWSATLSMQSSEELAFEEALEVT